MEGNVSLLLSQAQLCKRLGFNRKTLKRRIEQGIIPPPLESNEWYWPLVESCLLHPYYELEQRKQDVTQIAERIINKIGGRIDN